MNQRYFAKFFGVFSLQHALSALLIIAMLANIIGQTSLLRAQTAANSIAAVGIPISAPMGFSVNTLNGALNYQRNDMLIRGGDYPIELSISYDSRNLDSETPFSDGWQHNYDIYYEVNNANDVSVHMGGDIIEFMRFGDRFDLIAITGYHLINEGNAYILSDINGVRYFFESDSHPYVTRIDYAGIQAKTFAYDDNGHLQSISNIFGGEMQFAYSATNQLSTITDVETGYTISISYDTSGQLATITNITGATSQYTYVDGLLAGLTDPRGTSATIQYNNGDVISINTPLSNLALGYDNISGQTTVTEMVNGEAIVTTFDYDPNNQLERIVSPEQCETLYSWNERGQLTTFIQADGTPFNYYYTEDGYLQASSGGGMAQIAIYEAYEVERVSIKRIIEHIVIPEENIDIWIRETFDPEITTETAYRVRYEYENKPSVPGTIIEPNDVLEQLTYNEDGLLISATDASGNITTINYNERGDITGFTNGNGDSFSLSVNDAGFVISERDPYDNETLRSYDASGNVTSVVYANGTQETFEYDLAGNLIRSVDTLGGETSYTYDALNRLLSVTDAQGNVTQYRYDERGNLLSRTDANGNITQYSYDAAGNVIGEINPTGQTNTLAYDCGGNATSVIDAAGNMATHEYDAMGNLTRSVYADGRVVERAYDFLGNPTQFVDESGTTVIEYNGNNVPVQVTDSNGNTLSYEYDNSLVNRNAITYPDGTRYEYTYNGSLFPTSVTGPEGTTQYEVRFDGLPLTRTLPNGIVTNYTYNEVGWITQVIHQRGSEVLLQYDYNHNDAGNVINLLVSGTQTNSYNISYVYDELGQLIHSDEGNGIFTTYTYDAAGNRLTETTTNGETDYVYNARNQLIQKTMPDGLATLYQYDENGNLTLQIAPDDIINYQYDDDNRLIAVDNNGSQTEYIYNAIDVRVGSIHDGVRTNHIVDMTRNFSQELALDTEGSLTRFTYGIGQISQTGTDAATTYYLGDNLNSTIALADSNAIITESYRYSDFGVLESNNDTVSAYFTYTGEAYDSQTELLYLRARYYSPEMGRFVQEDEFRGIAQDGISQNRYIYVFNNPINYVDPGGYCPFALFATVFLGLFAGFFGAAAALGAIGAGSILGTAFGIFLFLGSLYGVGATVHNAFYADKNKHLPGGLLEAFAKRAKLPATVVAAAGVADFLLGFRGAGNAYSYTGRLFGVADLANNINGAANAGKGLGEAIAKEALGAVNTSTTNNSNVSGSNNSNAPLPGNNNNGGNGGGSPSNAGSSGNSNSSNSNGNGNGSSNPNPPGSNNSSNNGSNSSNDSSSGSNSSNGNTSGSSSGSNNGSNSSNASSSNGSTNNSGNGSSSNTTGSQTGSSNTTGSSGVVSNPTATMTPTNTATATPTATATNTATATATNTATEVANTTIAQGGTAFVCNSSPSVNVRATGSTNAAIVGQASANETLTLLGLSADGQWANVRLSNGTEGWIAIFLLCDIQLSIDPVITPTPTITLEVTEEVMAESTAELTEEPFIESTEESSVTLENIPFECPPLTEAEFVVYTGFFGQTFEEFMQSSGLASIRDGNFPPEFNPENPEPGVYLVAESVDGFAFAAEFREVSPTEYMVAINFAFDFPPDLVCEFSVSVTIIDGELADIVPGDEFANIALSPVPARHINPIPGNWRGQNNEPTVLGCGGMGSMIASQIGGNINIAALPVYTGDWTIDYVIGLLESEEPLPPGYTATTPRPNVYAINSTVDGGSISYELRVITSRRIEWVLTISFTDPEIGSCQITSTGVATYVGS